MKMRCLTCLVAASAGHGYSVTTRTRGVHSSRTQCMRRARCVHWGRASHRWDMSTVRSVAWDVRTLAWAVGAAAIARTMAVPLGIRTWYPIPMDITRLGHGDERAIEGVGACFDGPVPAAAATRFLNAEGHHILVAYDGETLVGFVSGVEMTHPDKGTERFLYEMGSASIFVGGGTAPRW
jgi:hypothetical protein